MPVEFPDRLEQLLDRSPLQASIRAFADRAGHILQDNKTVFFPDYTDHGTEHINLVIESMVDLIPQDVWDYVDSDKKPHVLKDADAVVIIGAALLHDIGMHVQRHGFLELIKKDTRFRPLRWFRDEHEDHRPDRPWHELWDDYYREARRFSERQLTNIIGEESARKWKFDSLPEDVGQWELNHHLIVGEFIRRHHARLAHEIAIFGFPGVEQGGGEHQFPAMGTEAGHPLAQIADLIGLAARSHGMSLRVCAEYLRAHYPNAPRPRDSAIFYPMALLRVADYLQIDRKRAPAILLNLHQPQSPISLREWSKHEAVVEVASGGDPRSLTVNVGDNISLPLYLQLSELIAGLQSEMDHATAVLDEQYGARTDLKLQLLTLAQRRVTSNINTPEYRRALPYVPAATGFSADPNILTLLVEPLYGKQPSVGVRELIQNAVDAVQELDVWCENHGIDRNKLDLPDQDSDVELNFIKRDDGSWILRVTDKGIGMTAETIRNYFLRAGVSFRSSAEWSKEFVDENQKSRVLRSGRFGVGAFAIFLLGDAFCLRTRHVSAKPVDGFQLRASPNIQLIQVDRVEDLPVGTQIEIVLSQSAAELIAPTETLLPFTNETQSIQFSTAWYCADFPSVKLSKVVSGTTYTIPQSYTFQTAAPDPSWKLLHAPGFESIYWSFDRSTPKLSCNGILIRDLTDKVQWFGSEFDWQIKAIGCPSIYIKDPDGKLPLTIQRYKLSDRLPFEADLVRDILINMIAFGLIRGPGSASEIYSRDHIHPLRQTASYLRRNDLRDQIRARFFSDESLRWCASIDGLVFFDPNLVPLLNVKACTIFGVSYQNQSLTPKHFPSDVQFEDTVLKQNAIFRYDPWIGPGAVKEKLYQMAPLNAAMALTPKPRSLHSLVKLCRTADASAFGPQWTPSRTITSCIERVEGALKSAPAPGVFESILAQLSKLFRLPPELVHSSLYTPNLAYVTQLDLTTAEPTPVSLIAQLWNEFLGPRPIPFDADARSKMIDEAREKPEMRKHIDQWIALKTIWEETGKRPL